MMDFVYEQTHTHKQIKSFKVANSQLKQKFDAV